MSWEAIYGSPGSACAIAGKGTGLNPGPESMPTASANHGGKLRRAAGAAQVRDRELQVSAGELRCRRAAKEKCSVRLGRSAGGLSGVRQW